MENVIGIYCIKNLYNNKIYIGQSSNIKYRMRKHKECLNGLRHHNYYLQQDWVNYGEKYFVFELLQECNTDELDELEKFYIKKYNNFIYNQTSGGESNYTRSDKTKNMVLMSQDTRREVYQINIYGKIINKFLSIRDACRKTGITRDSISKSCNGVINFTKNGYIFRFVDDYNNEFDYIDNLYNILKISDIKPVVKINPENNNLLNVYISISNACRENNLQKNQVTNVIYACRNENKIFINYKWKYFHEYLLEYGISLLDE